MLYLVEYIIDFGLGSVVILIGMLTNGLSARVFWHQGFHKHQVNVTLLALALTDLTCLTCAVIHRVTYLLDEVLHTRHATWWYKWVILPFGLSQVAMARVTFCLTALLSLERWVSVCHPFLARQWLTRTKLIQATISTAAISIALNVPVLLVQVFIHAHKSADREPHNDTRLPLDPEISPDSSLCHMLNGTTISTALLKDYNSTTLLNNYNTTPILKDYDTTPTSSPAQIASYTTVLAPLSDSVISRAQETAISTVSVTSNGAILSSSNEYDISYSIIDMLVVKDPKITYILICTLLVFPAICNHVVGFCTVSIIRRLRKASITRLSLSGEDPRSTESRDDTAWRISSREARLVKSTLAVMIIFIVCHTPTCAWAHALFIGGKSSLEEKKTLHLYFLTVFMFLETLNSSVNFFVYVTYFPGFKRTFCKLYPRWASKPPKM